MYIRNIILFVLTASMPWSLHAARSVSEEVPPSFSDFLLLGKVVEGGIEFTLTGNALVTGRQGGELTLVSGQVAVTSIQDKARYKLDLRDNAYVLNFGTRGQFPVTFKFKARVDEDQGWKSVNFQLVDCPLRKVQITGLPADLNLDILGASSPVHEATGYS